MSKSTMPLKNTRFATKKPAQASLKVVPLAVRIEQKPGGHYVTYLNEGSPFPSTAVEVVLHQRITELEAEIDRMRQAVKQ
jgi:hypothetical protein